MQHFFSNVVTHFLPSGLTRAFYRGLHKSLKIFSSRLTRDSGKYVTILLSHLHQVLYGQIFFFFLSYEKEAFCCLNTVFRYKIKNVFESFFIDFFIFLVNKLSKTVEIYFQTDLLSRKDMISFLVWRSEVIPPSK